MLIYVCVSTHGYGHAARQAAVLIELHRLQPDWRLVISSNVDETFLALVLRHVPVSRRTVRWDVGMLQADALGVDDLPRDDRRERDQRRAYPLLPRAAGGVGDEAAHDRNLGEASSK